MRFVSFFPLIPRLYGLFSFTSYRVLRQITINCATHEHDEN
jgi:hypothetical protein